MTPSRAPRRAARRASRAGDGGRPSAPRRPRHARRPHGRAPRPHARARHPAAHRPPSSRPAEPRAPSVPSRVSSSPAPLGLRYRLLPAGHGLARATTRPSIRARALASRRQALAVPQAAVASDLLQPLDVECDLTAKVPLDRVAAVHDLADLGDLRLGEIADARREIDARLLEDLARGRGADAVDVAQRHVHALLPRDVNSPDTGHALDLPL